MTFEKFKNLIIVKYKPETVLQNPGRGTSTIKKYSPERIYYQRGTSTISIRFDDLFKAYSHFKGKVVSSSDLKSFAPNIFDSHARLSGHSCNCTLLFLFLSELGLSGKIEGLGKRGKPFFVRVNC